VEVFHANLSFWCSSEYPAITISRLGEQNERQFMAWSCKTYFDFLFDQSPHFDKDILKDWFPTDDAWIGHVSTMPWDAFTGTEHEFDKVHVGAPDLSQAWQSFDTQHGNCVANACTPTAISVGWGSTRATYGRSRQRYETNVLCFDQINTRAKAKQQLAEIIRGIKDLTKTIWSDYIRANSLIHASTIYIAGAGEKTVANSGIITGNLASINLGSTANLPTSNLTIQYLQRFYEPLQAAGYFKSKYVPNGIFKLITDPITSQQLIEGNPTLAHHFKFDDFQKGGTLFKYGMSKGIGNFGISWDNFPARFYHTGSGVVTRVWPYVNTSATIGIKPMVNPAWLAAPIQYSAVWHPDALKRAVPSLQSVHPEMPFLTRDLGGKWTFTGPQSDSIVVTDPNDPTTTCVIDNKARNQGLWWADFEAGFRPEFMDEWTRGILHLREPGCVVDNVPCSLPPKYVYQAYVLGNVTSQTDSSVVTQTYTDINGVCEVE
jgi:hypothetical protein